MTCCHCLPWYIFISCVCLGLEEATGRKFPSPEEFDTEGGFPLSEFSAFVDPYLSVQPLASSWMTCALSLEWTARHHVPQRA
jgi:hypothetical protein